MEKLLNKQMEEFIEILESDKDLTSEDVWTNHEKKEWFKLKQQELLKEALAEERERVGDDILGRIVKNSTGFDTVNGKRLWHLDIDAFEADLLSSLDKPLTDK